MGIRERVWVGPGDHRVGRRVQRLKYQCPVGLDIEIYIHRGGHDWAGPWLDPNLAHDLELGPATTAIDATRKI